MIMNRFFLFSIFFITILMPAQTDFKLFSNLDLLVTQSRLDLDTSDFKILQIPILGFDISTYHLYPKIGLINLYLGFAVSHRSGVYKKISFFNNTQGGGNFVTLFTEYKF